MAESNFHRLLRAKITEVIDARSQQIGGGACKDFSHYKLEVGFIAGLNAALDMARELEKDSD